MGIFDFFKKLFVKEELPKPEAMKIEFDKLSSWLVQENEKAVENANKKLVGIADELKVEKEKILENIKSLKNAKLKNPNIAQRAKDIMEGNREQYASKASQLVENLRLPDDFNSVFDFCIEQEKALDLFAKSTVKNYAILQEFFRNESREVSFNMQKIAGLIRDAKKLFINSKIVERKALLSYIKHINEQKARKNHLEKEIKNIESEIKELRAKQAGISSDSKKFMAGDSYKKYTSLMQKKTELLNAEKGAVSAPVRFFSSIDSALKKFQRICIDDNLINQYRKNLAEALLEDSNLKIAEVISKLRDSLENNKIELKDKKKGKIISELVAFDVKSLKKAQKELEKIHEKVKQLDNKLKSMKVSSQLDSFSTNEKKVKEKITHLLSEKEKCIHEMDSIDIASLIKKLNKKINENLSVKVIVD